MTYSTEDMIAALKAARIRKKLSQRALSELVDLPQSYISKIENGQVDIGISTLTTLARALELEVSLVPRQALPAVEYVAGSVQLDARHWIKQGRQQDLFADDAIRTGLFGGMSDALENVRLPSTSPKYRLERDDD